MLSRKEILNKAYHDCMYEMYAKSQPEADYDNLIEEYCSGKIGKNEPVYNRHYLSMDEFIYIRDKYKEAYNIKKTWKSNIEFLEQLLKEGGLKDKYNPAVIDEDGFKHPGYRSAEDVKPLKDQISDIIKEFAEIKKRAISTDREPKLLDSCTESSHSENVTDVAYDENNCTGDVTMSSNSSSSLLEEHSCENHNFPTMNYNDLPIDMVEIDLKNTFDFLGEIIGETYSEEILDHLFANFCVGK